MPVEVVIPMVGIAVEKGKILEWLKNEGDFVRKGEPLFIVEIDKVTTEVESPGTGVLKKILVKEGEEVPVLTVVAIIEEEGEEIGDFERGESLDEDQLEGELETAESSGKRIRGMESFDLVVIGGGPGGYVSAIHASRKGMRVALVEKGELGGTCLNRGCIPTKALLARAKILKDFIASQVFKGRKSFSVDVKELMKEKNDAVSYLRNGLESLLEAEGVSVIRGMASFSSPNELLVKGRDGKEKSLAGHNVIIAAGSKPVDVTGVEFDGEVVHSTDTLLEVKRIPSSLLIVGGGAVGVEFATIFSVLGKNVTLVEKLGRILPQLDEEISATISASLERLGVRVLASTEVSRIEKGTSGVKVDFSGAFEKRGENFEMVLIAVGRRPAVEGMNIREIGVAVDDGAILVDDRMRTSVEGIYAVGDVVGGPMLAHAAFAEGIVAVENIAGSSRHVDYGKIPHCVYTFPEVATVGLTEKEAREKGMQVEVGRFPFRFNGRAIASADGEGFVKIVSDAATGEILGGQIVGESATELIGEILLGMCSELTVDEMVGIAKPHPTLSEAVTEAFLQLREGAFHMPLRR